MIYGFYFRFYKYTKNRFVAALLSKILNLLFRCVFFVKKAVRTKTTSNNMSHIEAKRIIENANSKNNVSPIFNNLPIDNELDLSIVVPVYNYVNVLKENIDSILNQKTKYKYEVILVDDGSTDGSNAVLQQYSSYPNVKVITQENGGIAYARNTGINVSTGKYLMFVDCDDTVHDDIVESMMDEAYRENYDMVMCAHNLSKENEECIISVIPNIYPCYNLLGYESESKIFNYAGLPWGKVFRRELWNDVRFFPGYWFEDSIIQFLIFTQIKTYSYLPKVLYEYRWYENNFSKTQGNNNNMKTIDRFWVLEDMIERYEIMRLPLDNKFHTVLLTHLSIYYYPAFSNLDEKYITALFTLARNIFLKYRFNDDELPYMLRQVEKALINDDCNLWKLASKYQ